MRAISRPSNQGESTSTAFGEGNPRSDGTVLSQEEVAKLLGMTQSGVSSAERRALAKLKKAWLELYP